MVDSGELVWRKSSFSPSNNCVEVAHVASHSAVAASSSTKPVVLVRDSKDPNGARLSFSRGAFRGLVRMAASQV